MSPEPIPKSPIDAVLLADWNTRYESLSAPAIVRLAVEFFQLNLALASSFGPEDLVLMHLLLDLPERPEIFVLDTGRLPPETYDLIERWRLRYGLSPRFYAPDAARLESYVNAHGPNAFYQSVEQRKQCCAIRKVEPLNRALKGRLAWITGLRREQSQSRASEQLFSFDEQQRIKINPLIAWTRAQVWDYIKAHRLPYNVLHDRGFASIGCAPCSRAIEPGEDERAGRWWWEEHSLKECGLHKTSDREVAHAPAPL